MTNRLEELQKDKHRIKQERRKSTEKKLEVIGHVVFRPVSDLFTDAFEYCQ